MLQANSASAQKPTKERNSSQMQSKCSLLLTTRTILRSTGAKLETSTYFKFQTHRWHVKSICTGERAQSATPILVLKYWGLMFSMHFHDKNRLTFKENHALLLLHLQELVVLSGTEGFGSVAIEGTTSLHLEKRRIVLFSTSYI